MTQLRIAACQLDVRVGDLEGNVAKILDALATAEAAGCDVALFPELAVCGYPPEDLVLKPRFVADNRLALEKIASRTGRCAAVVGFVDASRDVHNAAAVCAQGSVLGVYRKQELPNYSVFDEIRYFTPGDEPLELYLIGGVRVGVSVCEDAWNPVGPVHQYAAGGAELIVNLNASPYYEGRLHEREAMLSTRASDASCPVVYVNLVGGQDELVFDGGAWVFDAEGQLVARTTRFEEQVSVFDLPIPPTFRKHLIDPRGRQPAPALPVTVVTEQAESQAERRPATVAPLLDADAEVYRALVLGTRDYVDKNGFSDVVVGLSGGIDSSLVATIAVDALGPDRVHTVGMPSRYSTEHSVDDAARLAANLGIDHRVIAIEAAHAALLDMLAGSFEGTEEGLAEENLQPRVRGIVLMALSNKFGWLVLTTGNKSETAVGYSTLYGDTAGGFAVIKDVLKTRVYELCRWRNAQAGTDLIPESVLTKAPSAELRPDQRDDQTLPPYDVLDPLLSAYVEQDQTKGDLIDAGFDAELVNLVGRLVDVAEYKRRQSPPGVRVTAKAFGKDRRLPITNAYRG